MIDCLSNPDWIRPQMDFLLFLQNIRLSYSDIIDKFFLSITIFGEFWLPTLICAIVYWCVDFRSGLYLLSLESFNVFIAHFLKMIACVNRPWILDNRIHPSKLAVPFAGGYSFPSGHSIMSSSVVGGCAYLLRKRKFWCISLVCLVLLIGFSRLWLGVHSPQDVICGLAIGFTLVFALNPLINWAEKDTNRYLYLLGMIDVIVLLAFVYIYFFNTYRIDYVDGKLLVDPQIAKYFIVNAYTFAIGLINGCFLCRRFCPFDPKTSPLKNRILRGIIGSLCVLLMLKFVLGYILMNTVRIRYTVPLALITGMFISLIYPLIFTRLKKFI